MPPAMALAPLACVSAHYRLAYKSAPVAAHMAAVAARMPRAMAVAVTVMAA
jgi:hypothetical protein